MCSELREHVKTIALSLTRLDDHALEHLELAAGREAHHSWDSLPAERLNVVTIVRGTRCR